MRRLGLCGGVVAVATAAIAVAGGLPTPARTQQQLRVAIVETPPVPWKGAALGSPAWYAAALWESLTRPGDGGVLPILAASWKNVDNTTWQFTLRPNLTFSNGTPIDAAAVAENINLFLADGGKTSPLGGAAPPLRRVLGEARAIDKLNVEVKSRVPSPTFDSDIGLLPILETRAMQEMGETKWAASPVSSGPYKLKEQRVGESEFVPHAGSWHPGKVASLLIREMPERAARIQAVQSGQMHIALGLNIDAFGPIEAAGHTIYTAPAPNVAAIALMTERAGSPFKDIRVRHAINMAIDRDNIVKNLLRGRATPASQPAVPGMFGFNADVKPYPFDPERAKKLLANAGHPNGFKTTIEAVTGSGTADSDIFQQVALDLKRVGIEAEVVPMRLADWVTKYSGGGAPNPTDVTFKDWAFGWGYTLNNGDPLQGYSTHWCDRKPTWYCNESLRPKVEAARLEFDPDKRRKMVEELMKLSAEDAPVLFIINQIEVVALHKDVQNFKMSYRYINYGDLSLKN
ncbi:MAG: ABC transporter substrate-binding protein [Alphaproteobacteria bacterium]|nr:ABC transporter substrate-binding protein [Alphaproteobacteria bacterium]